MFLKVILSVILLVLSTNARAELTTVYKGTGPEGKACELEVVLFENGFEEITANVMGTMEMFFVDPSEESVGVCETPKISETDTEFRYRDLDWMTAGSVRELVVTYDEEDNSTVKSFEILTGESSLSRWLACRRFQKKTVSGGLCKIDTVEKN